MFSNNTVLEHWIPDLVNVGHRAIGFMRWFFNSYTQITVWMNYKQKNHKFAQNHCVNGFYEVVFPLLQHITPLENGGHRVCIDYKQKIPKFTWNHWDIGNYNFPFPLSHTNHTLGKRVLHSLDGLQAKNSNICKKPLRQWVLWVSFSIITHISPPWKTGATEFA